MKEKEWQQVHDKGHRQAKLTRIKQEIVNHLSQRNQQQCNLGGSN